MNDKPQEISQQLGQEQAEELMRSLLHKEGTWVDWGNICQQLQKAGYNGQTLFEKTGFQASQQNLIIVAAQVYESLVSTGVSEDLLSYYLGPKSDVLYEIRILNQEQRAIVAQLSHEKNLRLYEDEGGSQNLSKFLPFPSVTHRVYPSSWRCCRLSMLEASEAKKGSSR